MNTYFPTEAVDGPPPLPPPFGLLQAAAAPAAGVRIVTEPNDRWMSGIAVWPYPAALPSAWDACQSSGSPTEKEFGENIEPPEFNALTVYEPETCTSQQIPDQEAFKARAVAVLAAVESYRVAYELMTGATFGSQPYLSDGNADILNGGTAVKPNYAVQLLEEAIALTGRLGVIHCTPMLATALMGSGFALSDKTGVIRTINGIPVIPDFGYAGALAEGSHPIHGNAPGPTEEWAYATGPIDVRRSEIFTMPRTLAEALDRGVSTGATTGRPNTITYRAERYYVTDWDTALQATVLVDRCGTDCNPNPSS